MLDHLTISTDFILNGLAFFKFSIIMLDQRCSTHSRLAACGKWPLKCGESLYFQTTQNLDALGKTTQNSRYFYLIYTFNIS